MITLIRTAALGLMLMFLQADLAQAATVNLINDTQMATASWSTQTINLFGGFSGSTGQSGSGGNGGAYRSISHASITSPASGRLQHLHLTTWNPSTQGAITSLDMGVDVNCFFGGTSNAVAFGLILIQDGVTYFGPTFTALTSSGWRTDLRHLNLSAANFLALDLNPDFSSAGSTIQFGFYSSNGTSSGAAISSSSGADNFYVTLNAQVIPTPAALPAGLLLLTLLAHPRRRR